MANDIDVVVVYSDERRHIGKCKLVCAQGLWDPRFEGLGVEDLIKSRDSVLMQFDPKIHKATLVLTPIDNGPAPDLESHIIRGED